MKFNCFSGVLGTHVSFIDIFLRFLLSMLCLRVSVLPDGSFMLLQLILLSNKVYLSVLLSQILVLYIFRY